MRRCFQRKSKRLCLVYDILYSECSSFEKKQIWLYKDVRNVTKLLEKQVRDRKQMTANNGVRRLSLGRVNSQS